MSNVRVLVGTRKGAFILSSDGKRKDWKVERAVLCRMGDLPHEGFAGRPEPDVCVAVEQLVGAGGAALRRWRRDMERGEQQVCLCGRAGDAPVVRRDAASVGVQAGVAL